VQRKDETLRSYIQRWSIIKNSAEDFSDEQAVDAFSAGLLRSDLVEELGRTKPKTVSELMEVANRFADGEEHTTIKGGACHKSTEQADKGEGTVMKMAAQDEVR
jgi:hypothetical protein